MQTGYYPAAPAAYYPVQQVPSQAQYSRAPPGAVPYASSGYPDLVTYQQHRYATYVPPPPEPAPRASKHHRSNTISTPNQGTMPLKSAMKKRTHSHSHSESTIPMPMGPTISRHSSRAPSESRERERTNSMGKRRADASQHYIPGHLFVTFPSSNEFRVENIAFPSTADEIRQNLLPMWPHRDSNDTPRESIFRAVFNGTPWASSGTDYIIARRMIHTLWAILAHQGYTYMSTTSTGEPPAKLVFGRASHETIPYFFSISVSQSGGKFAFLDAPAGVVENLSEAVRARWPHRITADRHVEDGAFVFEVRKNSSGDVDRHQLASHVLDYFGMLGFKLDGSIPMGKAGPLGFGSRKELWILRSAQQRPGSASGQASVPGHHSAHGHQSAHGHHSAHGHGGEY